MKPRFAKPLASYQDSDKLGGKYPQKYTLADAQQELAEQRGGKIAVNDPQTAAPDDIVISHPRFAGKGPDPLG